MKHGLVAFGVLTLGCAITSACGSTDDDTGSGGSGGGGGSSGTAACQPTLDSCYIAGPTGPGYECFAKADFTGQDVTTLRVSSHQVASPTALAQPFVQDSIITKKSALKEPECNLDGLGQFNLLLSIDSAQKMVTIGGGVPQALIGAPKDGTCWANFTDTSGAGGNIDVKPVTVAYTEAADGTLSADLPFFVMPIYLEDKAASDSYVLVPLHEMTFSAKLSADKNCIGRYAAETLDKGFSCQPAAGEFAWEAGGRYEGYITVEEADNVNVVSLGETLCVVLSGDTAKWKGTNQDCKTSTGFTSSGGLPKGDWCAATNSAGGCQDSWRLVIDIAAQAIDIKGSYDESSGTCSG